MENHITEKDFRLAETSVLRVLTENKIENQTRILFSLVMEALRAELFHTAKSARWNKDYICSNCGCKIYPMDIDFGDFNFCPNCGAKMEAEK